MLAGAHLAVAYGPKRDSAAMTPPAKVSTASTTGRTTNQHAIVPKKPQKAACGLYLPVNKVIN